MLYMESRKSFEVGGMKKFNSLPSVKKYSANYHLCRVPKITHSVNKSLPGIKKTLDKHLSLSSAKNNTLNKKLFAECFLCDTRQRSYLPSARNNTHGKGSALGNSKVSRSDSYSIRMMHIRK